MFSPVGSWFYRHLMGVEVEGGRVIRVWPRLGHDYGRLSWVKGEVEEVGGRVEVEWEVREEERGLTMKVVMPVGGRAVVRVEMPVNGGRWEELVLNDVAINGGATAADAVEVEWREDDEGTIEVDVMAGEYVFVGRWTAY